MPYRLQLDPAQMVQEFAEMSGRLVRGGEMLRSVRGPGSGTTGQSRTSDDPSFATEDTPGSRPLRASRPEQTFRGPDALGRGPLFFCGIT